MRRRSGDAWRTYRGLECVAKSFESAELVERVSQMLNANTAPKNGPGGVALAEPHQLWKGIHMMTRTDASSTMIILGEPIEKSGAPATRMYRLGKSLAAVHFESAGKGRIVFLPEGAEVHVMGRSCLCKCYEVMFETQLYNIFKVDLLGPWSTLIKPNPIKPDPIKPDPIKPILAFGDRGSWRLARFKLRSVQSPQPTRSQKDITARSPPTC